MWLAALRETSKQQLIGEHLICEDHFLPEDITNGEVNSDAIPIMPPELEWTRPLSSSETKCSEEQEPYDDGVRDGGAPAAAEPPAQELPQQVRTVFCFMLIYVISGVRCLFILK